jgi:hypothetical protein
MLNDYREMLSALRAEDVEFLIIGAHAVAAHGIVRASLDFDIWVRASPENAHRLWRALKVFGAPLHQVSVEDFAVAGTIFQIGVAPHCIHITTSISGVEFEAAWPNRIEANIPQLNVPAPIIGRKDLVANKRASARPKDLLDIDDLEAGRMK